MTKRIIYETMKNLKNFSVLIPNTGSSQISFFVINELNKLCKSHPEIDAIVFYENAHRNCMPTNFATMQMSEAWGHDGPVIATSFSTAHKLANFPSEKRFFYVWDLEWIRGGNNIQQYESYLPIYADKSLELIARSDSHKKAIENAFNRRVNHVISDFHISEILEILQ